MTRKMFKVGDLVQLKSGGPIMTVKGEGFEEGEVDCIWFAGAKNMDGSYPLDTLILVPSPINEPKQ